MSAPSYAGMQHKNASRMGGPRVGVAEPLIAARVPMGMQPPSGAGPGGPGNIFGSSIGPRGVSGGLGSQQQRHYGDASGLEVVSEVDIDRQSPPNFPKHKACGSPPIRL